MNRIALLEIFGTFDFVTYYTIRLVENDIKHELSETEKFFTNFDIKDHPYYDEFKTIVKIINAMGCRENGAEKWLFRFEDAADALPSPRNVIKRKLSIDVVSDSVLRLYCIRLTSQVVILLNGGLKTANNADHCDNVRTHFRTAKAIAKVIDEMIVEDSLSIDGLEIINETGDDEIILSFK